MDLPVLPGPSLAELARTAVARAGAGAVAPDGRAEGPAGVAGPVRSFASIPPPLRTLLVCRCLALPDGARIQRRP
jgi:hypothetical protein